MAQSSQLSQLSQLTDAPGVYQVALNNQSDVCFNYSAHRFDSCQQGKRMATANIVRVDTNWALWHLKKLISFDQPVK